MRTVVIIAKAIRFPLLPEVPVPGLVTLLHARRGLRRRT